VGVMRKGLYTIAPQRINICKKLNPSFIIHFIQFHKMIASNQNEFLIWVIVWYIVMLLWVLFMSIISVLLLVDKVTMSHEESDSSDSESETGSDSEESELDDSDGELDDSDGELDDLNKVSVGYYDIDCLESERDTRNHKPMYRVEPDETRYFNDLYNNPYVFVQRKRQKID
jgi:hypothetical protein